MLAMSRYPVLFVLAMQLAAQEALSPPETVAKLKAPEGFTVTLFAVEPNVRQPISFAFDDRKFDHAFFTKKPPKSTGRELFSRDFLLARAGRELKARPADVVATLTFLTARTIGDAVRRFVKRPIQEVILSGGGAYNRTLVGHLDWRVWPAAVRPIDVYGFPPPAKEPAAFALLAAETVRGVACNVPSATGARRPAVLGKIVPGANFRGIR
jgi:anhydro-N-acetylmuramic acid kinase